jgi:hypothetical protein
MIRRDAVVLQRLANTVTDKCCDVRKVRQRVIVHDRAVLGCHHSLDFTQAAELGVVTLLTMLRATLSSNTTTTPRPHESTTHPLRVGWAQARASGVFVARPLAVCITRVHMRALPARPEFPALDVVLEPCGKVRVAQIANLALIAVRRDGEKPRCVGDNISRQATRSRPRPSSSQSNEKRAIVWGVTYTPTAIVTTEVEGWSRVCAAGRGTFTSGGARHVNTCSRTQRRNCANSRVSVEQHGANARKYAPMIDAQGAAAGAVLETPTAQSTSRTWELIVSASAHMLERLHTVHSSAREITNLSQGGISAPAPTRDNRGKIPVSCVGNHVSVTWPLDDVHFRRFLTQRFVRQQYVLWRTC